MTSTHETIHARRLFALTMTAWLIVAGLADLAMHMADFIEASPL